MATRRDSKLTLRLSHETPLKAGRKARFSFAEMPMRTLIVVTMLSLAACTAGKPQSTVNEGSTATGTGNTQGSFTAPGASVNSQSAKENARR